MHRTNKNFWCTCIWITFDNFKQTVRIKQMLCAKRCLICCVDNLKTLIRIATAFNMTIVEFLNVPEIIEFSEDDLEDESEKNEGQEETNKALREVVHRGE